VFKSTELIPKLEPAFLAGLRCSNPQIRTKFFEIFDSSMRRRLHDRLMYIFSSQNWEPMGQHYWIKQCIQLIFVTADQGTLSLTLLLLFLFTQNKTIQFIFE
jgi:transformation/transcription domain-associated protein